MRDSVKTLLSSIVDYAGLFPPAKLDMLAAMAEYVQHQISPNRWMLGRFVLPATRLSEFERLLPAFPLQHWPLSVIVSRNVQVDLAEVLSRHRDRIRILALEFPVLPLEDLERLCASYMNEAELYFEIPLDPQLETYLTLLQSTGGFAKIRTGGITVDAFPRMEQLSRFITACARFRVPFKATAGLHHPLYGDRALTEHTNGPTVMMHGFLNVAIAAALIYWQKIAPKELLFLLQEASVHPFQFQADRLGWQTADERHYLSLAELEQARKTCFRSFGSCSFQEPIHDLQALDLL